MKKTIWHRFPKEDYEYLKKILESLVCFEREMINAQEKKKLLQLLSSMEKGFKEKKNLNLKLEFLIQAVEFYHAVHRVDLNHQVKLQRILQLFYNYISKKGG